MSEKQKCKKCGKDERIRQFIDHDHIWLECAWCGFPSWDGTLTLYQVKVEFELLDRIIHEFDNPEHDPLLWHIQKLADTKQEWYAVFTDGTDRLKSINDKGGGKNG